ncbi:hydrogenase maturation protein HypF [Paramagnetospirillum kuznetsovii]|uniref:Hydrogenase maturation protein HypF n=1 Tax=Paramagnetospirillum kuznetsovii TaxID=2053833 RepID=A0A364NUB3_9PROT|nr:hydrogenase maturation protein HypF [Paramagnetospirillum kuznetsovii]RAU20661.1 hydrogenase maturation protein HypF [Paramagnetospirillum kuznetsovii]
MTAIAAVIPLPRAVASVLAVGPFLKNTVCVTKDDKAFVSADHGDLGTPDSIIAFENSVAALLAETGAAPVRVAHDLHPDFHSTRFALGLDLPAVAVQHHHAHAASVAVENGHDGPVIALSLDGFGLGPGHQSWGGELLLADGAHYRRLGHLALLSQPGGDMAAREPWRMAAAALHRMGRGDEIAARFGHIPAAAMLGQILDKRLNCPETSSAGRLFDAACGLLGIHPIAKFEGQAPMALEAMVTRPEVLAEGWSLQDGILDLTPLLARLSACTDPVAGANLFHGTLIEALAAWAIATAEATGTTTVTLGGGCFLNKVLTAGLMKRLAAAGLRPLTALTLSPGDAGLSLGQAWIAALTE